MKVNLDLYITAIDMSPEWRDEILDNESQGVKIVAAVDLAYRDIKIGRFWEEEIDFENSEIDEIKINDKAIVSMDPALREEIEREIWSELN